MEQMGNVTKKQLEELFTRIDARLKKIGFS